MEQQLYQHMKNNHKMQAIEDDIIDYIEEEEDDEMADDIEILSDISLPSVSILPEFKDGDDISRELRLLTGYGSDDEAAEKRTTSTAATYLKESEAESFARLRKILGNEDTDGKP